MPLRPAEVFDRGFVARSPWWWALERLVVGLAAAGFVAVLYYPVAAFTADRHLDLSTSLDQAIPYLPSTVWIYMPVYLALFLVGIFGLRDRETFYRSCASIALSAFLCCAVFLVVPSTMAWPPLPDAPGATRDFLAAIREMDVPNNTFPSQHVALSFCVALGAFRYHRGLGASLLFTAVLIALSTMTTKQHYWVDSPGGIAMALAAHALAFRGFRRKGMHP